jgi:hypothetical protein
VGTGVAVGLGVAVGSGVAVGTGVAVGAGVAVGTGVAVGAGVGVGVGSDPQPPPPPSQAMAPKATMASAMNQINIFTIEALFFILFSPDKTKGFAAAAGRRMGNCLRLRRKQLIYGLQTWEIAVQHEFNQKTVA